MWFQVFISLYFIYSCTADIYPDSFIDTFQDEDLSRWVRDNDRLSCINDYCWQVQCDKIKIYYKSKERSQSKDTYCYIHITLNSDCQGDLCCTKNDEDDVICTKYTSGLLISEEKYFYGSFRFTATAIKKMSGFSDINDAFACFAVESNDELDPTENHWAMNMCVQAKKTSEIIIMYHNINDNFEKTIPIGRDVGIHNAIYRIDWTPHLVSFYLNGEILASFTSTEVTIPNEPLNIKIGVLPEVPFLEKYDPSYWDGVGNQVDLSMQIFRVRYIRWIDSTDSNAHDELFVLDNFNTSILLQTFIASLIILVMVVIIYLVHMWGKQCQASEDFYVLM